MDFLEDGFRQPRQQRHPGLERRAEGEFAAHRAQGDRRDLGLHADQVGQLVDRLDRDDGGVQIAQQEALAALAGRHGAGVDRAVRDLRARDAPATRPERDRSTASSQASPSASQRGVAATARAIA